MYIHDGSVTALNLDKIIVFGVIYGFYNKFDTFTPSFDTAKWRTVESEIDNFARNQ